MSNFTCIIRWPASVSLPSSRCAALAPRWKQATCFSRAISISPHRLKNCHHKNNVDREIDNEHSQLPSSSRPCAKISAPSATSLSFWASIPIWRRAGVNTFRCLIGCTSGDFAAMWFLQAQYPHLGVASVMAVSMISGLTTSMLLETALLHLGRDRLPWSAAARTAAGMSLISMLTMELAENAVDFHLTGGIVQTDNPAFWAAAVVSMAAGFLAPLPYNYLRLRRYGIGCH